MYLFCLFGLLVYFWFVCIKDCRQLIPRVFVSRGVLPLLLLLLLLLTVDVEYVGRLSILTTLLVSSEETQTLEALSDVT